MKLETRTFPAESGFGFDVVDTDATLQVDGETLPEHLHTGTQTYAKSETAHRNGEKWAAEYAKSGDAKRRRMAGYDSKSDCRRPARPVRRVRKRVGA